MSAKLKELLKNEIAESRKKEKTRGAEMLSIFAAMIPFLTIYLGKNITEIVPQTLYGIDVILIALCNHISCEMLKKHNPSIQKEVKSARISLYI